MRDGSTHVRSSGRAYITATAVVTAGSGPHRHNLGMMRSAHNPRQGVLHCASLLSGRCGCWRLRERRSGGGGSRGFRFRLLRPQRLSDGPWRRPGGLKFGYHRVGIDRCRCGRREVAGNTDDLHRNGHRLKFVQRVGYGETIGGGHGNRTWRLAAWSQGSDGIGSLRRRFKLDRHRGRCRPEGVHRERRATGQTEPCHGTYDDTTHDPSVLLRPTATVPGATIGASRHPRNHAGQNR